MVKKDLLLYRPGLDLSPDNFGVIPDLVLFIKYSF